MEAISNRTSQSDTMSSNVYENVYNINAEPTAAKKSIFLTSRIKTLDRSTRDYLIDISTLLLQLK